MRWKQVDDYCLESEDKRWTITKAYVNGQAVYTLWHGKTWKHRALSAQECRERCEAMKTEASFE